MRNYCLFMPSFQLKHDKQYKSLIKCLFLNILTERLFVCSHFCLFCMFFKSYVNYKAISSIIPSVKYLTFTLYANSECEITVF